MYVRFWGTRGSIPTPGAATRRFGGNTACVEIRTDSTLIVCDAGTGIRELGLDLMQRGMEAMTIHMLFSHAHWDHIQGFPFFTPAYFKGNTIYVYGTEAGDDRFHRLISGQMDSADHFPVRFSDLQAQIVPCSLDGGRGQIGDIHVSCIEQKHPSFGYSFEQGDGKVVYATDQEIDLLFEDPAAVTADLKSPRPIPAHLTEFVRDAGLLIADAQYTDDEYLLKTGWGHTRATTATDLAVQAGVKHLALFHHDPLHEDEAIDAMVDTCRERARRFGSDLVIFGAREGMELSV